MLNLQYGLEIYAFSALFVYIRILDAKNYKVCTDLGNVFSAYTFAMIGIMTLLCATFGVVLTFMLLFRCCKRLSDKYCCCCGHALLMRRLRKVNYSSQEFSQNECAICLLEFQPDSVVTQLPCNDMHVFHHACIRGWVDKTPACPLCKKEITSSDLARKAQL